jgi:hypothetical protein
MGGLRVIAGWELFVTSHTSQDMKKDILGGVGVLFLIVGLISYQQLLDWSSAQIVGGESCYTHRTFWWRIFNL